MNAPRAGRPKSGARNTRISVPAGRRPKVEAAEAPILLSSTLSGDGPSQWNEGEPLRATVLIYAPEVIAEFLPRFAQALFSPLVERGLFETLEYRGSHVKAKLRAAMLDLRYTARFLASVAREAADVMVDHPSPLSEEELGHFADQLALDVEKIASTIEARIEPGRGKQS